MQQIVRAPIADTLQTVTNADSDNSESESTQTRALRSRRMQPPLNYAATSDDSNTESSAPSSASTAGARSFGDEDSD